MSSRKTKARKRTARAKRTADKRSAAKASRDGNPTPPNNVTYLPPRAAPRYPAIRDLTVLYEGSSRTITPRPPDISSRGMFINTAEPFHEGAILRLSFRLPRTQRLIEARCEVRYCLPGVGIGVEYVDLDDGSRLAIEKELNQLQ